MGLGRRERDIQVVPQADVLRLAESSACQQVLQRVEILAADAST